MSFQRPGSVSIGPKRLSDGESDLADTSGVFRALGASGGSCQLTATPFSSRSRDRTDTAVARSGSLHPSVQRMLSLSRCPPCGSGASRGTGRAAIFRSRHLDQVAMFAVTKAVDGVLAVAGLQRLARRASLRSSHGASGFTTSLASENLL